MIALGPGEAEVAEGGPIRDPVPDLRTVLAATGATAAADPAAVAGAGTGPDPVQHPDPSLQCAGRGVQLEMVQTNIFWQFELVMG